MAHQKKHWLYMYHGIFDVHNWKKDFGSIKEFKIRDFTSNQMIHLKWFPSEKLCFDGNFYHHYLAKEISQTVSLDEVTNSNWYKRKKTCYVNRIAIWSFFFLFVSDFENKHQRSWRKIAMQGTHQPVSWTKKILYLDLFTK